MSSKEVLWQAVEYLITPVEYPVGNAVPYLRFLWIPGSSFIIGTLESEPLCPWALTLLQSRFSVPFLLFYAYPTLKLSTFPLPSPQIMHTKHLKMSQILWKHCRGEKIIYSNINKFKWAMRCPCSKKLFSYLVTGNFWLVTFQRSEPSPIFLCLSLFLSSPFQDPLIPLHFYRLIYHHLLSSGLTYYTQRGFPTQFRLSIE